MHESWSDPCWLFLSRYLVIQASLNPLCVPRDGTIPAGRVTGSFGKTRGLGSPGAGRGRGRVGRLLWQSSGDHSQGQEGREWDRAWEKLGGHGLGEEPRGPARWPEPGRPRRVSCLGCVGCCWAAGCPGRGASTRQLSEAKTDRGGGGGGLPAEGRLRWHLLCLESRTSPWTWGRWDPLPSEAPAPRMRQQVDGRCSGPTPSPPQPLNSSFHPETAQSFVHTPEVEEPRREAGGRRATSTCVHMCVCFTRMRTCVHDAGTCVCTHWQVQLSLTLHTGSDALRGGVT